MEANPDWWDKAEHNISRIVYRPLGADATRMAALLSGEVDLVTPIAVQDVDRVGRSPDLKVIEVADLKVALLGLNIGGAELNDSDVKGEIRSPMSASAGPSTRRSTARRSPSACCAA